jgi:predicted nucleotide-binding protein
VHGHDHDFRDEVVRYMRRDLQMLEPVILDGQASAGRTVIEKLEEESAHCHLAVVLLTPDDEARTRDGHQYKTARPNVWIELGYFLATFGRKTGRTLLIYRSGLEIPTDLSGLIYIDATAGISDPNVSKRLEVELNKIVNSSPSVGASVPIGQLGTYEVSGRLKLAAID